MYISISTVVLFIRVFRMRGNLRSRQNWFYHSSFLSSLISSFFLLLLFFVFSFLFQNYLCITYFTNRFFFIPVFNIYCNTSLIYANNDPRYNELHLLPQYVRVSQSFDDFILNMLYVSLFFCE